ncbi:cytochrome c oxidase assembly protein [Acidiphilium sp. AL]|uniref:Cytochrome c oxidase assembly protein n=1 Tax=Acidiphilium iwatense TaxID=768198 RepID=A0ABS9DWK8_9PROT|nr:MULTISPECIES: cytochrome c oxidase assembly protein [Acidiphilium]MCF3947122.1 cytochrome c oxidase assembly protein [Acidiphilium iwatense]MCU4160605.1 cytochrome c oxidase assembly protein [Acidiphilium sp. AL]
MDDARHGFDRIDCYAIGAILIAGAALDLACRFVPADLPYAAPFVFNIPVFALCWLFAFWYGRGLARTAAGARPALWRSLCYFAGIVAIYAVVQTRFEYAAQHMFFLNRLQQMTLGVFGPFLIAFAWPRDVLARGVPSELIGIAASKPVRAPLAVLRHPLVAAVLAIAVTDIWVIPSVDFVSMLDPTLYAVMNLSMIATGLLFWLVVLDPRPRPACPYSFFARMAAGFLTMFPQIAVAGTIALSRTSFYDFYELCGRLYPGISPIHDQLLGGIIQWIPPGMLNTAVLFVLLHAIRKHEDRQTRETVIPPGARVIEAKWTGR